MAAHLPICSGSQENGSRSSSGKTHIAANTAREKVYRPGVEEGEAPLHSASYMLDLPLSRRTEAEGTDVSLCRAPK